MNAPPRWQPYPTGAGRRGRLPWWQWWVVIVPALLLCLPFGLVGLWRRPGVAARVRLLGSAAAGLVLVIAIATSNSPSSDSTAAVDATPTPAPATTTTTTPAAVPETPTSAVIELVAAPRLRGSSQAAARQSLAGAGLVVGSVTRQPSGRPAGTVLSQDPPPGGSLSPGTTVDLVVASPLPRVPDLAGLAGPAAQHRLTRAGFAVVVHTRTVSSGTDGTVLEQHPAAGTPVRPGATVTLVIRDVHAPTLVQTNCTPGYSPCLPPASDYDCAGGSGNGPAYADQTEVVTGSDPYELDSDGDGYGCE
ncbi:MAG TPA: PASTA domain-containing protein [Nocardioides sp.]|nr:PASTA domain-containing protein [Nocardioides sp.]